MSIFAEAFSALKLVESNSNEFKLGNKEDEAALKQFLDDDDSTEEFVDVIDVDAIEDEDGETLDDNDHNGDIICRCPECQSLIFFKKDDLVKSDDEDDELVNVDEECPYCKTIHGFRVIGQVEPFETDEVEVADKAEEDEETPEVEDEVDKGDDEPDDEEPIEEAFDGLKGGLKGASVGAAIGSFAGPMGTLAGASVGNAIGKTVGKIQGIANKLGGDKKDEESVAESVEECGKLDKLPSRKMTESKRRVDNRNHSLKEAKAMTADAKAQKLKDRPTSTAAWMEKESAFFNSLANCKSTDEIAKKIREKADADGRKDDSGVDELISHVTNKKTVDKAIIAIYDFMLAGHGRGMGRFNSRTKTEGLEEANGEVKKFFKEYEIKVDGRVYENSYTEGRANYISNYFRKRGSDVEVTPKKVLIRGEFAINKRNKLIAEQEAEYANESLTESNWSGRFTTNMLYDWQGLKITKEQAKKLANHLNKDDVAASGFSSFKSWFDYIDKTYENGIDGLYKEVFHEEPGEKVEESLIEAVQNVSIDTDQETITVATKKDTSAEMITPAEDLIDEIPTQEEVDAEAEDDLGLDEFPVEETGLEDEDVPVEDTGLDLEDDGVDVDVDEFDEDDFSGMGESYLRKTYSNVESFKTSGYRFEGNNIFVEGLITFKNGKKAKTTFAFEAKSTDKDRLYLKGTNKHLSESKDAFTLVGKAKGKKLMVESLEWNYNAKDENGKSTKIKGIANR